MASCDCCVTASGGVTSKPSPVQMGGPSAMGSMVSAPNGATGGITGGGAPP